MFANDAKSQKFLRFDSLEQEAFLNLWRTYDRLKTLEDALFDQFSLTAQQYNALRLLKASHPEKIPTLVLAGQLVSRAPDITRLLDRLVDRGYIERERPAENRRSVYIGITEAGLELLDTLAVQVRDCHRRQLGHLSPQELETLTELLSKVREPHEMPESLWRDPAQTRES